MPSKVEPTLGPPGSRDWWARLLREGFGLSFWCFAGFAFCAGLVCYLVLGASAFATVISEDFERLTGTLARVAAAQVVAGFVWVLLSRERLLTLVGPDNAHRGVIVATAAGIITPGGPASAFALLAVLASARVDRGVLVAYITSWALLGAQRIVVWDLPLMGAEFSAIRFLVCVPLPVVAGMIARRLPLALIPKTATRSAPKSQP